MEPQTAGRARYSPETGRVNRMYMDQNYRKWRDEFSIWFEEYLNETNDELLNYLTVMNDGRPIRNEQTGKLLDDFNGYLVRTILVLKRPKGNKRTFPVAQNTPDLDNMYKAVTDGIFESRPFKAVGIDDLWIQTNQSNKRYTALGTDEKPHIEFEILKIEL